MITYEDGRKEICYRARDWDANFPSPKSIPAGGTEVILIVFYPHKKKLGTWMNSPLDTDEKIVSCKIKAVYQIRHDRGGIPFIDNDEIWHGRIESEEKTYIIYTSY